MSLNGEAPARQRRRGAELEDALLQAAWDELTEHGYADLTLEAVAQRAGTSRAVLYRRWAGRRELAAAAARHVIVRNRGPMPTLGGPLREDLLAILTWANGTEVRTTIEIFAQVGSYLAEEGLTFGEARALMMGGRSTTMHDLFERAAERGEVDPGRLTPRIESLAFDLFRHELIMRSGPVPQSTLEEIVDDIVIPLVRARAGRSSS
ncbi:TetR/AcrR family transcriptional regulator [Actinotalea sp. M2MS4P-6]|uniref:TetR/AcrR family transcriptional regulator n=1 Tax=Actinotalea sp. M2MS4P-6 TaxID=2983762 RepID=UPI0021E36A43|nr:TetR/AcrR family transcriptional regulator [Actinotalea sp. M2MS4P-6]MCV2395396.1 TetR/AcrR family transcriptional regulator [Actinotalea sp. M2MS4P-6]